ncbi:MAG TPA: ABC transporter permease [Gemmatimonadales bacterium]
MATFGRELKLALRRLRAEPGFSLTALITLALGIGAAVAIFTVVDSVMLRPLPYDQADRLVQVLPGQNANIALADAVAEGAPSLSATTGLSLWSLTLTGEGEPAAVSAQFVDAGFFPVFGVTPVLGRPFVPEERDPSRSDVVVLSHGMWQRRFGGDPSVIGRRIQLDGSGHTLRTVIGVMPRGFVPPLVPSGQDVEAWAPLSVAPGRTVATDSTWYVNWIVGRLKAGATVEGAAEEVRTAMARLHAEYAAFIDEDAPRAAGAMGLLDSVVGDVRGPLWMLLSSVGLILLLACANLANLLLARGDRRRQEFAVRAALGASRERLIRGQLFESGVLALLGGVAGVMVAQVILGIVNVSGASGLPRSGHLGLDLRVLAFALTVSAVSVAGFGLLPALRATAGDLRVHLGSGARSPGRTRSGRGLGFALIAAEVALAMVIVTGAALLMGSLRALRAVDPGLEVEHVLAARLEPPSEAYGGGRAVAFYEELLERLRALPGVEEAGAIQLLPLTYNNWAFPYLAQGHTPEATGRLPSANFRVVTPGYFRSVGMRVLVGRDVQAADRAGAPAVGLINRAMAELLWPGEDAVGKEIRLFGSRPFTVIGVVGDVRQHALKEATRPEMYIPLPQFPVAGMVVMVRTAGDPGMLSRSVRAAIHEVRGDVPISDLRPLAEVMDASLARERFFASVLGFFGVLALSLGAVGVYGVMAYAVGARRGEFSLRMALGATAGGVVRSALVGGLAPLVVGLGVGVVGAWGTTRLLAGLLFGVGPMDPGSVAAAAMVLVSVAAVAVWVPARRAGRVEPGRVLSAE